jgi:serine/threonine protein kinase
MSPEHIQGKARPASDQYSLGIVVYEWLSGDRPFQGSFVELCTQHLFSPVPPLREKIPAILPEVEQVVLKALAKDPKQRFDSVQAFADALEQASQLAPKIVVPLPQSLPNDALRPFSESSPVSEAFSLDQQIRIEPFIKDPKQRSDRADALEQTSKSTPEVMISLSSSLPEDSSELTPTSTPFVQSTFSAGASPLNLQTSSEQQIMRQISQEMQVSAAQVLRR